MDFWSIFYSSWCSNWFGVFFKAAVIYKTTGTINLGLLAWILAGIISICAGLTTAELAAAIPETGGMIVWVEKAYGKTVSYLLGWAQAVIYYPASIAAAAAIFFNTISKSFWCRKKIRLFYRCLCRYYSDRFEFTW